MKRLLSLFTVFFVIMSLVCPYRLTEAATVKINKTSITIADGKSTTLRVTGTNSKVVWSSNNKKVATVSNKGVVTGRTPGNATVTAIVNKKSFSCKVTVNESFNASIAIKNIDYTDTDTGKGVIIQFKNNYSLPFNMDVNVLYYDESGTMIGKSNDGNIVFDTNTECALYFNGPHDANYSDVPYNKYEVKISAKYDQYEFYKSNVKDMKVKSNFGADNVMIEVTNTGKHDSSLVPVSIVFYKDNNVVGYDYTYADLPAGGTDYLQLDYPHDKDYNTIHPTDYKVYVNNSYYID